MADVGIFALKYLRPKKTELSKYTQSDECTNHFPHIIDLDRETDNFLYETKNFLRDLLNDVVKVFFPDINFDDARSFFNGKNHKGDGKLTAWASSKFGKDHKITLMLRADQPWIEELVRKRNAVEHPGGHSGELKIQNFALTKDGKLIKPVWARTGEEGTYIVDDMVTYCHWLLTFAEELIIFACIEQKLHNGFQNMTFYEIPEEKRSPETPTRYRAGFKDQAKMRAILKAR